MKGNWAQHKETLSPCLRVLTRPVQQPSLLVFSVLAIQIIQIIRRLTSIKRTPLDYLDHLDSHTLESCRPKLFKPGYSSSSYPETMSLPKATPARSASGPEVRRVYLVRSDHEESPI